MNKWTLPEKTDWMKEQMEHEPTRAYAESIYKLVKQHGYAKALEIGCIWGVSTLAILMAENGSWRLTSVDKVGVTHAPEEVEANDLNNRWQFIHSESKDFCCL